MYLTDLMADSNNSSNNILGSIHQKLIFESNPIVKVDPINDQEVVTKKYLFKLFESIFGPNFYENKLASTSPVSIYTLNLTNAECIEGGELIFELAISPILIANLKLKLEMISTTAIAGVDFENALFYSADNLTYSEIQDNIININVNLSKVYIKIKTKIREDTEYYGDKILVLKVKEIVLYDSPENPFFIFNDVGIGKIKEIKEKPTIYELNINPVSVYKSQDVVFELKLNKVISNLIINFELNNLTAFSDIDYNINNISYSKDNINWIISTNGQLQFLNTDKLLLKIPTFNRETYSGDKVFLLNINSIENAPVNSIINIINSVIYATIRDQYLPTVESYLNVRDSYCNEGESLIFETELVVATSDLSKINNEQIIIYFNVKNLTAFSGVDYSEVMYWSYDNSNYTATSTRQVIYTKENLKVYVKFVTINSAATKYNKNVDRSLILKPELIIKKPDNLNLKISDIAIGKILDISNSIEFYNFTLQDSECEEGNYLVFDLFSDKPLTKDLVLLIQTSTITAIDNIDYYSNSLQYSINEGSTWIDSTDNNIIFHKNLTNIKLRLNTIKSTGYSGNRSLLLKIKSIIEKPYYYNINYADMAIGTIKDLDDPITNYEIKFEDKVYDTKQGNDFVFKLFVYPPLRYDNLQLKLDIVSEDRTAIENTDYSFRFSKFSTNNGISWSSVSEFKTITLNKNTSYFTVSIPTFQNLSNMIVKNLKFKIDSIVNMIPNSNFDISKAFVLTKIN